MISSKLSGSILRLPPSRHARIDKFLLVPYHGHTMTSGNRKISLRLADGLVVEAVYYGSGTLCISSQAGCAVGCPFCASGSRGLLRNLTVDELEAQLLSARQKGFEPARLTISGIGEPLHNWLVIKAFLDRCRERQLPVSVTTTGTPLERLAELLATEHNGVMLSLHAADSFTHRRLVPHGPDLAALDALFDKTLPTLSRRRRRKLGINYLLLAGINDSDEALTALLAQMQRRPDVTVHLLACNPVADSPFRTDPQRIDAWHAVLTAKGIAVRRPNRWRNAAEGGCGTLFVRALDNPGGLTDE